MNINPDVSSDIFTYSQIINCTDYNKIMSEQHLYIGAADKFLSQLIRTQTNESSAEVVELGCGPARILLRVREAAPNIRLSAIDADRVFVSDSQKLVAGLDIDIIEADAEFYQHKAPVDIFYSQGFHHHVPKGRKTRSYLKNIFEQLKPGGIYILSDEFLPNYNNDIEREQRVIVWYSHIIAHALLHDHKYLAQEEAKTLLDDLYEGRTSPYLKSIDQINHVLSQAPAIDGFARDGNIKDLALAVNRFQIELENHHNLKAIGEVSIDLSRHDYKICDRILREEVLEVGFSIEEVRSFGPIKDIGAMTVYILRK